MLEELFQPETIAVIGASRSAGKVGHDIVANLVDGGFAGTLVPVNPAAGKVLGLDCHESLASFGKGVDLSIIAVPAAGVFDAVQSSIKAGARSVVVVSAGFKETGPRGAAEERRITDLCKAHNVRLLGPNCLGLINTGHSMNASFAGKMPPAGPISILSQSGALCTAILDMAAGQNLGLAKVVSIGNKADLSEIDFLQALAADKQTRVIAGYLEDIHVGDLFMKVAEEASSQKPVVILKSGTTTAGIKAASSHTGVLVGTDTPYGAAFKRSGVIRADTFEALFDYTIALALQPLPNGNRVLIITNAGGPGIMAVDAVVKAGLEVAAVARNTSTALRNKLPAAASIGNPIDVLGDADPDRYAAVMQAAQQDEEVDAIIILLTPQAMTRPAAIAKALARTVSGTKPVLAVFMGGKEVLAGQQELRQARLPNFNTPERAVAALRVMCEYGAWRRRPPRIVARFRVNRRRVERVITRRLRTNRLQIEEVKTKNILQAYGFRIPEGFLTGSSAEAVEIAERIGYPVAMKVVSPDIIHKSDLGGVRLNVGNSEAVQDGFDLMMLRIGERTPTARIEGIYVEKMLDRGLEVIIGMNRDPQFGPMLMFGLGGIFVEVMKDVTFHLAPITSEEAMQMLMSTRSYEILEGKRGHRGVDLEAIADGLQRISQLTTDFPQIAELDINPFIVGEPGKESFVADARMTLKRTGEP
jgi:acetyl coenzyme A synthetase (ADP forming)-like protein